MTTPTFGQGMATPTAAVPSSVDLELVQGADTPILFIIQDSNGDPIDLSTASVRLTVYDYQGGTVKLVKTNAAGSHENDENGKTLFTISRTDITDTLTTRRTSWVYEVRRIQSGGEETVHIQGAFDVLLPVTG